MRQWTEARKERVEFSSPQNDGDILVFFSRGKHKELSGLKPGSLPSQRNNFRYFRSMGRGANINSPNTSGT
jgi:hypothetical protein